MRKVKLISRRHCRYAKLSVNIFLDQARPTLAGPFLRRESYKNAMNFFWIAWRAEKNFWVKLIGNLSGLG